MTAKIAAPGDLSHLSNDELRDMLLGLMGLTVDTISKMAAIVRVAEDRGADTSEWGVPPTLMKTLRTIAYGQLLPDVFVRFNSKPGLMRKIQALPMPNQRRIANGETVELVVWDQDGKPDKRKVDPLDMQPEQVRQVFGPEGIRSELEQIMFLEQQRTERRRYRPKRVGSLEPDHERGGAVFKGKHGEFIPKADLEALLASLR